MALNRDSRAERLARIDQILRDLAEARQPKPARRSDSADRVNAAAAMPPPAPAKARIKPDRRTTPDRRRFPR